MSSSATRALRILETVGAAERPLGPTEIGQALGIAAGTAFRGLDALERAGFLARFQASPKFVLGKSVAALRQNLLARFPIRDVTAPYLRQLAFASGETASLTVRLGWYGLRIATAPGTNEVTSAPPLGAVRPLAEGLSGRAILAHVAADAPAHVPAKWTPVRRQEHAQKMAARIATSRSITSSRRTWRGARRGRLLSIRRGPPGCARTSAIASAS
jgi:DNA-binding IclR family transcriptional regulator